MTDEPTFPNLPPVVPSKSKPEGKTIVREHKKVKPVFLQKMHDELGTYEKVGEKIGTTGKPISDALQSGQATSTLELAARAIYELEMHKKPKVLETQGKVFCSMLIEKSQIKALKPWLDQSGVQYKFFQGE